jgi:hypothetical protein
MYINVDSQRLSGSECRGTASSRWSHSLSPGGGKGAEAPVSGRQRQRPNAARHSTVQVRVYSSTRVPRRNASDWRTGVRREAVDTVAIDVVAVWPVDELERQTVVFREPDIDSAPEQPRSSEGHFVLQRSVTEAGVLALEHRESDFGAHTDLRSDEGWQRNDAQTAPKPDGQRRVRGIGDRYPSERTTPPAPDLPLAQR